MRMASQIQKVWPPLFGSRGNASSMRFDVNQCRRVMMLTFDETDQFDLKDFSIRLNAFIATEHYFVEGGLVISLNGPFGSGKTTFLEMWRNDLIERRKQENTLPLTIVL